ncbi:MAG: SGNH/GDSL hydrolase family protein [Candidatus Omnitrophica bacterium]|nr:SGNH/GDSL hydrolase family protein [Candidatus Omnitrophota bacterium]
MRLRFAFGRHKYRVKKITLVFLFGTALLAALFLSEILVRCLFSFPERGFYFKFRHIKNFYIPQRLLDGELFWKPKPEFLGLKYAEKKGDGVFRIICIGDSVTQSYDISGRPQPLKQTYPYQLQSLLERIIGKGRVEVLNAGIGGYSSLQGLRYLQRSLWKYNPDLVISWFGVNDHSLALFYPDKEQRLFVSADIRKKKLLENSALFLFLRNEFFIKKKQRVSPAEYFANCEQMVLLGKEKKFKIIFIAPFEYEKKIKRANYYDEYKHVLELLAVKYNIRAFDILPAVCMSTDAGNVFIDNCHFNPDGNAIVAKAIFNFLKDEEFIQRLK